MSLHSFGEVGSVRSRKDLVAFLRYSADGLVWNPGGWENGSLESFLSSLAAWLDDMPG